MQIVAGTKYAVVMFTKIYCLCPPNIYAKLSVLYSHRGIPHDGYPHHGGVALCCIRCCCCCCCYLVSAVVVVCRETRPSLTQERRINRVVVLQSGDGPTSGHSPSSDLCYGSQPTLAILAHGSKCRPPHIDNNNVQYTMSLLLRESIQHMNQLEKLENFCRLKHLKCLIFVNDNILPHFQRA